MYGTIELYTSPHINPNYFVPNSSFGEMIRSRHRDSNCEPDFVMDESKKLTADHREQTNALVQAFGDQKRWVNYRLQTVEGKTTKVPYTVTGLKASSTDQSTWSTYEEVKRVSDKVGIVFTPDQKLLGIDIDHCLKEHEIIHEQKNAIVAFIREADTYTEISPSGEGLHLFLNITEPLPLIAHKKAPFECYTSGRYFTVTGVTLGEPRPVRTVTKDEAFRLLAIIGYPWNKAVKERVSQPMTVLSMDDSTVLNKMFASKNGAKIKALYQGDTTGYNEDDSSADMALCSHLAFWTGKNADQMERIWLASPLGSRNKTQDRKDYRDRTITTCIQGSKEVYEGGKLQKERYQMEKEFQKPVENVAKRQAVITCFADIEPEPISWLWPNRIALGKLTLIAGDPGLGKSLLTAAMAATVSKGYPWPVDKTPSPIGDVLVLSAEDDAADTLRPRLDAAGADCQRIHILQSVQDVDDQGKSLERMFSFKRDLSVLEQVLPIMTDCRLLVIDPVSAYLDGTDSHKNADIRGLLAPLAALAARCKIAVVLIQHLNKNGGGSAIYRPMGSLAFIAAARAAFIVTKDSQNPERRLLISAKNNIAKDSTGLAYSVITADNNAPVIVWEQDPVVITADEALAIPKPDEERTATDDAVDFLQNFLPGRSVKVSEVQKEAREAGITEKSLRRAREKLGIKPKKSDFTGGWEWMLPEDAQSSQDALFPSEGILEVKICLRVKPKKVFFNHKTTMEIKHIPIKDLKSAAYNPRRWDEKALADLIESIKRFGLVDPLIVNAAPKRKNIVIGGHFRLAAAKTLGFTEVPVVYVSISNLEQEKELNLRLNRNLGSWDAELLKAFDAQVLLDIGFEPDDLTDLFDDVLEVGDDQFDVKKELERIDKPITQKGELYQLGSHRLLCGDALNPDDVKKLMGEAKADMVYSDPPYNIGLDYYKGISTSGKYSPNKVVNDSKAIGQYRAFLETAIKNALEASRPDVHVFLWCDERYIWMLQTLYEEHGLATKRVCLWVKNNIDPTPQVAFNKVYEPCIYGTRGKPALNQNMKNLNEILNKDIQSSGIYDDLMAMVQIWLVKRDNVNDYEHPTQKPITLNEKPIKRCTNPGQVILDLFGGSGSTLIAAEQLKRKAYLMELDPIYCDLIIKRYEQFTGDNAVKIN